MAITELYADEASTDIPRVSTAFGGGAIKPYHGTCGALTGALLAIGYIFGRNTPGINESKTMCFNLAGKLQDQFVKEVESVHCPAILERLGEQENMEKCKKLAGMTAGMLAEITYYTRIAGSMRMPPRRGLCCRKAPEGAVIHRSL